MFRIIVDENVANASQVFSDLGEVILLHGREISNKVLKDADALIVRSITKVDKSLLEGTNVKFVGTATIGKDHIDIDYLVKNNIAFADAKGCNAEAVKEFVFTALAEIAASKKLHYNDLTLGIVGVGNIGSKIAAGAKVLGIKTILNDPPLQRQTGSSIYNNFDEILKADMITLHVPLNKEGIDKTFHLFDYENLSRLKDGTILINSSRGSVIDNEALERIIDKKSLTVVLDVWENEPEINSSLLGKIYLGTPHIAGYSYEGKINGTKMMYSALCRFLGKEENYNVKPAEVKDYIIKVTGADNKETALQKIFRRIYDITEDDSNMRKILTEEISEPGKYFDRLRKDYRLRREFSNYTIVLPKEAKELVNVLTAFRFKIFYN